jgi:hypothetical protein
MTPGGGYRQPQRSLASRRAARSWKHLNGPAVADFGPARSLRTEASFELGALLPLLSRSDVIDEFEALQASSFPEGGPDVLG